MRNGIVCGALLLAIAGSAVAASDGYHVLAESKIKLISMDSEQCSVNLESSKIYKVKCGETLQRFHAGDAVKVLDGEKGLALYNVSSDVLVGTIELQ